MSEATETAAAVEAPPGTEQTSAGGDSAAAAAPPPVAGEAPPADPSTEENPDDKADDKAPEPPPAAPAVDRLARAKAAAQRMSAQRQAQARIQEQAVRAHWAAQRAQQEAAARTQEVERLRQERDERDARLRRIESDPLSYLRDERRLPADELARRAVEDADPAARVHRLEAELRTIKDRDAQRERDAAEREQRAQQEAEHARVSAWQRQQQEQAQRAFIRKASDETAYPTLAAHAAERPRAILREAMEIIEEAANQSAARDRFGDPIPGTGHVYSDEEALEYLEAVYAKAAGKSPNGNGASDSKRNAAAVTQSGPGSRETTQAGKPRTLSGKDAGQQTQVPPNFDDLSDAEQKRILAARYKALTKG